MKSEDKPSFRERSTFLRLGRWLFTWPRLRRIILVLVWVITLIALFYAEEDWRGRHAWHNYRQKLEARGIPVELAPLIPKPVPDEQNFAMSPLLAPLYDFVPGTQQWRDTNALAMVQKEPPRYKQASDTLRSDEQRDGDWARGLSIDLRAWESGFDPAATNAPDRQLDARSASAKVLLAELQEWTPILEEMRAASRRPYSRFNIHYQEENTAAILLPHLAVLKRFVQVLKLRASAELATGQTAQAFDDLDLAFRITDAVKDEPILITMLVRMSEVRLILQPIWEGMAAQKWSDEQLKRIQQQLSPYDFLSEANRRFDDDRAGIGNEAIQFVRKSPMKRADMVGLLDSFGSGGGYSPLSAVCLQLIPSGWFYAEQIEYNRLYDLYIMPLIDLTNRLVSPELSLRNQQELARLLEGDPLSLLRHHRMFARVLVPAVSGLATKIARSQTAVDLGVTACALERYRLANGRYPADLAQLVPAFLSKVPNDVIDGKPLRYRTEAGRFVLYSIGWNAKDDGGEYPPKTTSETAAMRGTGHKEPEPGDWVWRYSAG